MLQQDGVHNARRDDGARVHQRLQASLLPRHGDHQDGQLKCDPPANGGTRARPNTSVYTSSLDGSGRSDPASTGTNSRHPQESSQPLRDRHDARRHITQSRKRGHITSAALFFHCSSCCKSVPGSKSRAGGMRVRTAALILLVLLLLTLIVAQALYLGVALSLHPVPSSLVTTFTSTAGGGGIDSATFPWSSWASFTAGDRHGHDEPQPPVALFAVSVEGSGVEAFLSVFQRLGFHVVDDAPNYEDQGEHANAPDQQRRRLKQDGWVGCLQQSDQKGGAVIKTDAKNDGHNARHASFTKSTSVQRCLLDHVQQRLNAALPRMLEQDHRPKSDQTVASVNGVSPSHSHRSFVYHDPALILIAPFLSQIKVPAEVPYQIKILHVVRDGRDIALGKRHQTALAQSSSVLSHFLDSGRTGNWMDSNQNSRKERLIKLWSDWNLQVVRFFGDLRATTTRLMQRKDQPHVAQDQDHHHQVHRFHSDVYLTMRIEELMLNPLPSLVHLSQFVRWDGVLAAHSADIVSSDNPAQDSKLASLCALAKQIAAIQNVPKWQLMRQKQQQQQQEDGVGIHARHLLEIDQNHSVGVHGNGNGDGNNDHEHDDGKLKIPKPPFLRGGNQFRTDHTGNKQHHGQHHGLSRRKFAFADTPKHGQQFKQRIIDVNKPDGSAATHPTLPFQRYDFAEWVANLADNPKLWNDLHDAAGEGLDVFGYKPPRLFLQDDDGHGIMVAINSSGYASACPTES